MNKYIIKGYLVIIIAMAIAACQSAPKEPQHEAVVTKDSTAGRTVSPSDTGYAEVNGLKLYYEVYGTGKPLVLLHGSFMNIPMNWGQIIPRLAGTHKVIVAEMQGHGRTRDIPREIGYEAMADDVSGLLKHLRIDSADVLGYSMGGGVAYQMAIRHPEQVRRLVVLSGTYAHNGWWPDVEASFAAITGDVFKGSPIMTEYARYGNDTAHFNDFVKKVMSADLKPYDWTKEVKNIKAPLFIGLGDADGVRYEHALELFRAKGGGKMGDLHGMPTSRLVILPGTTHIGMMMHADMWIPMVSDFLDSDLSTAPPAF
ncbi:alpha/beta fold hydrolase [Chitinophaga solisilvae]|uniref:Alpha/beta hydrolase n=1 Tax=Chitinophaga solisilvae TaxID=1233460 RepID=A0A433WCS0_9BACT|nr:alpha/beta hydrolase [Chitinophaga solisilvae]NSL86246.1 alpha/beta hydrolase [Chitinophaga solisilvae]